MISLKKIWTRSIARQLMLGIALVHAVMMTIFVVDLVGREKKFLIDLSLEQASGLAETLAANGVSWVLAQDFIGMDEIIKSQAGFPGLKYAMFLDTNGKVLAYTDIDQVGKYIEDDISKKLLQAKPETYPLLDNSSFIDVAAPILANNQQIGWARVAISREGITDNINHVTKNGLVYTLVAILVGTIFAWVMARGLTTDIRRLVSCANRSQEGEKGVDFVLNREDELGKLAEDFQDLHETLLIQLDTLKREIVAKENAEHKRDLAEMEKENLQNRLSQAQKMEAIGTLAGGIAHDFNNVLGIITGYAEMALDDTPSGSSPKKDLEKVIAGADRAKDLVKQILTFSRQTEIECTHINIKPLIKEGVKMLRSSIPSTISIIEDINQKCGTILADPTHVHQILMNLGVNAYHAMEKTGGVLSVSLKNIFIGQDDKEMLLHVSPGEYLKFTVTDTGCGVSPDIIDKIFDPYFTTKSIGKGTGMGLSIIHGIMADYGGVITVESRLGEGTSFHVFFPVVEREELLVIKKLEVLPGGTERVLLVDDEELLAEMGKDMLERMGYSVTVRHSSLEALNIFQNSPNEFDLVITDQTMPDMTGADLSRRMMQIRPNIPIILCTGYSNLINEDLAKDIGIKGFAMKPLTKSVMTKLIRKVMNGTA